MKINNMNTVSFNGLWEPAKKISRETGTYNRDKIMYTLYDITYRPFADETKEAVQETVNKHFLGRSFCLWDKFDGQNKAAMYHMNFIRVGEPIEKADAEKLIKSGFRKKFFGGIPNDKEFWAAYSNNTYEPFDVSKLSQDSVKQIAKRCFNIKI